MSPEQTGPATFPIRKKDDTTPNIMVRFSGGTDLARIVFVQGAIRPIPIPVTARQKPSPYMEDAAYCSKKVAPTKAVAKSSTR